MHITQAVILFVLLLIAFDKDKDSSLFAFILIVHSLFYYSFVVDTPATQYYSYSSYINLILGLYLYSKNKYHAAICSYILVPWDLVGFFAWYQYYDPDYYDNISILIHAIQVITITPKRLLNGLRNSIQHIMAKPPVCNSSKARVTMYKSHSIKETKQ